MRAWLRERLAAAGLADDAVPLRQRVRAFQVAAGLEPDGVPGPLTLMLLARQGGGEREPRLRAAAGDR
jgi:general secretion pathway protein A